MRWLTLSIMQAPQFLDRTPSTEPPSHITDRFDHTGGIGVGLMTIKVDEKDIGPVTRPSGPRFNSRKTDIEPLERL